MLEILTNLTSDIDPVLARSIAVGDTCPISHLPMTDIDPGFIPRAIKRPLSRVAVSPMKSKKAKGKMRESPPRGGILSFFGECHIPSFISHRNLIRSLRSKSYHSTTSDGLENASDET